MSPLARSARAPSSSARSVGPGSHRAQRMPPTIGGRGALTLTPLALRPPTHTQELSITATGEKKGLVTRFMKDAADFWPE